MSKLPERCVNTFLHDPRQACSAICTATCFEIMSQLSTQSDEQSVTISALTGDALKRILGLLDAKDLSSAVQVPLVYASCCRHRPSIHLITCCRSARSGSLQVQRAHKVTCTVVSTLDADLYGTSEMASSVTLRVTQELMILFGRHWLLASGQPKLCVLHPITIHTR